MPSTSFLTFVRAHPRILSFGVFFHQGFLASAKGWDLAAWTAFFAVFSTSQIAFSLAAGPLIDRFSSTALMPFFLLPLGAAHVLLAVADGLWLAPAFLGLAGVSAGISMTLGGALWAELYGTRHLGAIRSAVASLGILGTAASPAGVGVLIDRGWSIDALGWLAAAYIAGAVFLVLLGVRR